MSIGKLFIDEASSRCFSPMACAKANNLDVEIVKISLRDPRPQELLDANPLGKVPTFVGSDGFVVTENFAISAYFCSLNEKTTLLGKTKQDYASILRWSTFAQADVNNKLGGWVYPLMGIVPYNKKNVDDSIAAVDQLFSLLESHLTKNTFFVGERVTLADISVYGILRAGFIYVFDKAWQAAHPALTRWYTTVVAHEAVKAVDPSFELLTEAVFSNPPKSQKTEKKPKAAPQPKAEKKAAANDEDDEPASEPAPKAKHPLELLPKASVPLDEWKRTFSNNSVDEALKWMWSNIKLDDEYSLWKVSYKYNDELSLTFMSNNLIRGFFARLEGSRKYIFGSLALFGENHNSVIEGVFLIRGQDYVPAFDVAPDYDCYEFVKLDASNEADKAYVEARLAGEAPVTVEGKEYPVVEAQIFK